MQRFLYVFLICFGLIIPQGYAQILDDTSDGDEELFNEMFSDYSETENSRESDSHITVTREIIV